MDKYVVYHSFIIDVVSLSLFLNYYLLPGIVDHGNKVSDTSEAPCDTAEVKNIFFN